MLNFSAIIGSLKKSNRKTQFCVLSAIFPEHRVKSANSPRNRLLPWFSSVLFLFLLSASSLSAQTVSPTYPPLSNFLWSNTSVNAVGQSSYVGGTGLPFRYMLPKNFNPNVKYAAIVYLHGVGECGTDDNAQLAPSNNTAHGALALVTTANPDNQTNYPCFFIAPQIPVGANWSNDTVASEIQNLLAIFKTQYPNSFDTTRLYLTGNSLGGFGTYDIPYLLAQSNHLGANPFAAIVPMSGELGAYDGREDSTEPNIPLWTFHGVLDTNVPIAGSDDIDVPALRALGRSVIYTRYATGTHDIWEVAYQHPQLLPWLSSQKLGQADQSLSNFTITGSTLPSSTCLTLTGTASTAMGYTGISWLNTLSNLTGNATSTITPTWSLPNIPLLAGSNLIQVTAQAPNNIAMDLGVSTNYGGTTTVNLPFTATPLNFSQWEAQYPSLTDLQPNDTPENDGVTTLLKFLFNINPSQPMSATDRAALPVLSIDTTTTPGTPYLSLTYRQHSLVTGITVNVQTSTDLITWTTVTPDISQQVGTDANTGDPIMEVCVKTNGMPRLFIRLNVTQP